MNSSRREFLGLATFLGIQTSPLSFLTQLNVSSRRGASEEDRDPYLKSVYAPLTEECERPIDARVVSGSLPADLSGTYFRNGPNPLYPSSPHHWFDGDGMIHRIAIEGGQVQYSNRFVQTRALEMEKWLGGKFFPGILETTALSQLHRVAATAWLENSPLKDTSNTDVIFFQNQLISLWWLSGKPYALDPETLEPRGVAQFDGYFGNVSAHARVDPRTGDLFFLDFGKIYPWVKVVSVSSNGQMNWSRKFSLPGPRVFHDILFTENFVILMDFPVGFQMEQGFNISLDRRYPSRIYLIPRDGQSPEIIFETEPCYVLHGLNAYETNGAVEMTVNKFLDPFRKKSPEENPKVPYVGPLRVETRPERWILDLQKSSRLIETSVLDYENTEFPRINDEYLGIKSRFSYHPRLASEGRVLFKGLIKYDWETERKVVLDIPFGKSAEEFVFIPRSTRKSEDDGWIATLVHDFDGGNHFEIYDAHTLDPTPIASIQIPQRIPAGFHSKWVPRV